MTQPAFFPATGILTLTLLSAALVLMVAYPRDVFLKSFPGHNVDFRSSLHLGLSFLSLEGQLCAETSERQTGATTFLLPTN